MYPVKTILYNCYLLPVKYCPSRFVTLRFAVDFEFVKNEAGARHMFQRIVSSPFLLSSFCRPNLIPSHHPSLYINNLYIHLHYCLQRIERIASPGLILDKI